MIPNVPIQTHVDLANEFNRKPRIHVPEDPNRKGRRVQALQPEPAGSLARRLVQRLAVFGRIRYRQPALGE